MVMADPQLSFSSMHTDIAALTSGLASADNTQYAHLCLLTRHTHDTHTTHDRSAAQLTWACVLGR
jgi:hypothetical protein